MRVVLDTAACDAAERFDAYREAISATFVPLDAELTELGGFRAVLRAADLGRVQAAGVRSVPHTVRRQRAEPDRGLVKIGLQVTGRSVLSQGDRTALVRPGDLVLYDTSRRYDLEFHDDYGMVVFMLDRDLLSVSAAELADRTVRPVRSGAGPAALLLPLLRGVEAQSAGGNTGEAVLNLLAGAFAVSAAPRPLPGADSAALRATAQAFIGQHLTFAGLDVGHVAGALGVSVRDLRQAFADGSVSVAEHIRSERLAAAAADLVKCPVAGEVGARWGMPDPALFARLFRARYGMSPEDYRAFHTV